jgi:hypothetical protein
MAAQWIPGIDEFVVAKSALGVPFAGFGGHDPIPSGDAD